MSSNLNEGWRTHRLYAQLSYCIVYAVAAHSTVLGQTVEDEGKALLNPSLDPVSTASYFQHWPLATSCMKTIALPASCLFLASGVRKYRTPDVELLQLSYGVEISFGLQKLDQMHLISVSHITRLGVLPHVTGPLMGLQDECKYLHRFFGWFSEGGKTGYVQILPGSIALFSALRSD